MRYSSTTQDTKGGRHFILISRSSEIEASQMVHGKAFAFLERMIEGICRPFLFFRFVSGTHDEQRPRPDTGIVTTARETKRPQNAPQQKTRTHPKHTTGPPAAPKICTPGHTSAPRGPEPVRHGMIPKFGRFGRKMTQSSGKRALTTDAHR